MNNTFIDTDKLIEATEIKYILGLISIETYVSEMAECIKYKQEMESDYERSAAK